MPGVVKQIKKQISCAAISRPLCRNASFVSGLVETNKIQRLQKTTILSVDVMVRMLKGRMASGSEFSRRNGATQTFDGVPPHFYLQSCLRLQEKKDLEMQAVNPAYQTKNALPSRSNFERISNGIEIRMGN